MHVQYETKRKKEEEKEKSLRSIASNNFTDYICKKVRTRKEKRTKKIYG